MTHFLIRRHSTPTEQKPVDQMHAQWKQDISDIKNSLQESVKTQKATNKTLEELKTNTKNAQDNLLKLSDKYMSRFFWLVVFALVASFSMEVYTRHIRINGKQETQEAEYQESYQTAWRPDSESQT